MLTVKNRRFNTHRLNRSRCIAFSFYLFPLILISCGRKTSSTEEETTVHTRTPVTITHVTFEPLTEYVELNATSQFVQKNYVKANVNGYVTAVNAALGKYVSAGQTLFTLKTKEAQSIGNAVNRLDPSFRFSGINNIKAPSPGYVAQLSHQQGDYVQDGEQLAVLNDAQSFAFMLNLPYELRPYIIHQKTVELILPDNTKLTGTIASLVPTVDPASQSQQVIIKVPASAGIPENLIAKVRVVKNQRSAAQSLPKPAVLSDDAQTEYWVMQMINDSTAIKVPVKRGIETKEAVEIISPQFSPADRILLTGNYGLSDTAGVVLEKKPAAEP
jgi:multidrug efflux pump subunit AcrA (membrane-fusion protein)